MEPGALIDIEITGIAHGGVFVGRHDGRVVFVADAIPGETVTARITEAGERSFWRAETVDVIDASPHRRAHVWPEADLAREPEQRPGGADLGHIALDHQRALKAEVLTDALVRFARLSLPVTVEPVAGAADDGTSWRTRVGLHVDADGRIGPFAARSHRVVDVATVPLATEGIRESFARLASAREGRVDLVEPADGVVRVLHKPAQHAGRRGRRSGPRPAAVSTGEKRPDREEILERVGERDFRLDAGGFWQVHRGAAAALDAAVREAVGLASGAAGADPAARHLDLYGGVGLLAASIADAVGADARITTVEADRRASEHARFNLAHLPHARPVADRVDRFLSTVSGVPGAERDAIGHGVVVLDPPRSGAGRTVVESIARLQPRGIVYVACDPVALARDIGTFRALGYETAALRAFDLFPHSHHLEAVAVLRPAAD